MFLCAHVCTRPRANVILMWEIAQGQCIISSQADSFLRFHNLNLCNRSIQSLPLQHHILFWKPWRRMAWPVSRTMFDFKPREEMTMSPCCCVRSWRRNWPWCGWLAQKEIALSTYFLYTVFSFQSPKSTATNSMSLVKAGPFYLMTSLVPFQSKGSEWCEHGFVLASGGEGPYIDIRL